MSYARQIEDRAIFNNWNSYSRGVGRLRIRGISEQREGNTYYGNRIGTEVCFKEPRGRNDYYRNNEQNGSNWIFRCYADGTGYLYPDKLEAFNYPTKRSILNMIYKHFRVIKEEHHEENRYEARKFQILRRKPLGVLSRKYFLTSITFGDYLANKYNDLKENN